MLERTRPSGVVRVNRAIAEAELGGPEIGLRLLDETPGLEGWHFYWAARAELLRRAGRQEEAAGCYRRALSCEMNDSDRSFLERRLAEMSAE
jgi:RNA polymerase sigma-70 factor (ECF subfamily)